MTNQIKALKYGETTEAIEKEVANYVGWPVKNLEMEQQARVRDLVRRGWLRLSKTGIGNTVVKA